MAYGDKKKNPLDEIYANTSAAFNRPVLAKPTAMNPTPSPVPKASPDVGSSIGTFVRNAAIGTGALATGYANKINKDAADVTNFATYPSRKLNGVAGAALNAIAGNAPRPNASEALPGITNLRTFQNPVPGLLNSTQAPAVATAPVAKAPIVNAVAPAAMQPVATAREPYKPRYPGASIATNVPSSPGDLNAGKQSFQTSDGRNFALNANGTASGNFQSPTAIAAGTNNFGNVGANNVAASPQFTRAANYSAPSSGLSGDTRGTNEERKALLSSIDSQLFQIGSLNTRGKKDLAANLIGFKRDLTGQAFKQAGDLTQTGAQLDNSANLAALNANAGADINNADNAANASEGQFKRNFDSSENATQRNFDASQNELKRNFDLQTGGSPFIDEKNNLNVLNGTNLTPITGKDGKPVKAPTSQKDELTKKDLLSSYTDQLKSYDDVTDPGGTQRAALNQNIEQIRGGGNIQANQPATSAEEFIKRRRAEGGTEPDDELIAFFKKQQGAK